MAGRFGNIPPNMSRGNPAIKTGGGSTKPSNPIGPGNPKSISAPDMTMAKVTSPIGPGKPRSIKAPKNPDIGVRPGRPTGIPNPINKAGTMASVKQPKLPGLPGREGGVKGGKKGGRGKGGMKNSANVMAAGVPPGYGP